MLYILPIIFTALSFLPIFSFAVEGETMEPAKIFECLKSSKAMSSEEKWNLMAMRQASAFSEVFAMVNEVEELRIEKSLSYNFSLKTSVNAKLSAYNCTMSVPKAIEVLEPYVSSSDLIYIYSDVMLNRLRFGIPNLRANFYGTELEIYLKHSSYPVFFSSSNHLRIDYIHHDLQKSLSKEMTNTDKNYFIFSLMLALNSPNPVLFSH
ncbi:MAG: hypothetical protein AB8E15_11780 [Bdellovibrionales bacterium]